MVETIARPIGAVVLRSEEHTSELQSHSEISYAVFCLKKKKLQNLSKVMARQQGVLIMSCDVDFGSGGAPVFSFESVQPLIVSVVSAMSDVEWRKVSLGTQLVERLQILRAALDA